MYIWYIDISLRWFLIQYYLDSNTHFPRPFWGIPPLWDEPTLKSLGHLLKIGPLRPPCGRQRGEIARMGVFFHGGTHDDIPRSQGCLSPFEKGFQCWLQLLVVAWCAERTSLISQQGTSLSSLLRLTWPRMVPHKMATLGNMRINHGQAAGLSPGPRRARSCWMRRLLGDAIFGFWRLAGSTGIFQRGWWDFAVF